MHTKLIHMSSHIAPSRKRLTSSVFFVCIFACIAMFFGTDVFAQEVSTPSFDETMFDAVSIAQGFLKMIYLILWPLLVVAGNALDNTFVYGEFINLDAPLFQMRNISKNFANFALGFGVLYKIFEYLFGFGKIETVKEYLVKFLIAGVGIQISRFVLGAIIDISTILTYALGGLPMTLISQTPMGDHPIIGVNSVVDIGNFKSKTKDVNPYIIYYTWGGENFSPCMIHEGFIVGKMYDNTSNIQYSDAYCVYKSYMMVDIAALSESQNNVTTVNSNETPNPQDPAKPLTQKAKNDATINAVNQLVMKIQIPNNGENATPDPGLIKNVVYTKYVSGSPSAFPAKSKDVQGPNGEKLVSGETRDLTQVTLIQDQQTNGTYDRVESFNQCDKNVNAGGCGLFLRDLISESEGFVGPLVTLYVSLMNFSDLHISDTGGGNDTTTYATFFEFMLKAATAIILIIPLFVLAIVLVVRLGILRVIIATSPLILIYLSFNDDFTVSGSKISFGSITGLIFAPVLPVFALAMSILFLFTLQSSLYSYSDKQSSMRESLGMETEVNGENECVVVLGLTKLCYKGGANEQGGSFYTDLFANMLMNAFGLGLVWTLLFAAIKSTSITGAIADSAKRFATDIATSMPMIPIPGVGIGSINNAKQGYSSLKDGLEKKYITNPNTASNTAITEAVNELTGNISDQQKGYNASAQYLNNAGANPNYNDAVKSYQSEITKGGDKSISKAEFFNNIANGTENNYSGDNLNSSGTENAKKMFLSELNSSMNAGKLDEVSAMLSGSAAEKYLTDDQKKTFNDALAAKRQQVTPSTEKTKKIAEDLKNKSYQDAAGSYADSAKVMEDVLKLAPDQQAKIAIYYEKKVYDSITKDNQGGITVSPEQLKALQPFMNPSLMNDESKGASTQISNDVKAVLKEEYRKQIENLRATRTRNPASLKSLVSMYNENPFDLQGRLPPIEGSHTIGDTTYTVTKSGNMMDIAEKKNED